MLVQDLAWTPDGHAVLAEWMDNNSKWEVAMLTLGDASGAIAWGPTVLTLDLESSLAMTPNALDTVKTVPTASSNAWFIDRFDGTFRLVAETPVPSVIAGAAPNNLPLEPIEIVEHDGTVYFMGGPATEGRASTRACTASRRTAP